MRELIKEGTYFDLYVSNEPCYSELKNWERVFQIYNRQYDVLVAEGVHEIQAHVILLKEDEAMIEYMNSSSNINSIMEQITGGDDETKH